MATFTETSRTVKGNKRQVHGTFTFDSSYPTGGEAVTAAQFGLSEIGDIQVSPADNGQTVKYDRANKKVMLYTTYATEATNASNQAARSAQIIVEGY